MTFTRSLSAAAVAALMPALAFASEASGPGWVERDFGLTDKGKVVAADDPEAASVIEAISSGDPDGTGIMFYCIDGKILASIATKPHDFPDGLDETRRVKTRTVDMYADGEKVQTSSWTYLPSLSQIRARDHEARAKLFNAVIRGEKITLETSGLDGIDITMPPVDDTFTAFARDCGL